MRRAAAAALLAGGAAAARRDVPATVSSYLASGANASSVDVLAGAGLVAVGGFLPAAAAYEGAAAQAVLGGTTGAVTLIDAADGRVAAVLRVGERVDGVSFAKVGGRWMASVVGSFGAAAVAFPGDPASLGATIAWSHTLPVYTGARFPSDNFMYNYSMCQGFILSWDYAFHPVGHARADLDGGYLPYYCQTELAADGTAVVFASGHHGYDPDRQCAVDCSPACDPPDLKQCQLNYWPVLTFAADGTVLGNTTIDRSHVKGVAIDAETRSVFVGGFNNSVEHNDAHQSVVQVAYLHAYDYSLSTKKWANWDFAANDVGGLLADTRVEKLAARGGQLLVTGLSSGGDTMFFQDPKDITKADHKCSKGCDSFAGIAAQMDLYVAALDPKTGAKQQEYVKVIHSQGNYTHVGSNPKKPSGVGSFIPGGGRSAALDSKGRPLVAGFTDCCVPNRTAATVAGVPPGPYVPTPWSKPPPDPYTPLQSESVLLALDADWSGVAYFSSWMQKGAAEMHAVASAGGVTAVVGNVAPGGAVTTHSPIAGTGAHPVGFVAFWADAD